MKIRDIVTLLEAFEDEISDLRQVIKTETWNSYIVGRSTIERKDGDLQIQVRLPEEKLSNHEELNRARRVEKVSEALRPLFEALEDFLPGHALIYHYDPQGQKHMLTVDGREALEAVSKSWADHLPLIKRILGSGGAGDTWLFDTMMTSGAKRYNADQMVKAPDLASAILRHHLFKMTLTERKRAQMSRGKVYAATCMVPHPEKVAISNPVDKMFIETAWNEMIARTLESWPWPTRPTMTLTVTEGEIDYSINDHIHQMLAPEDARRMDAAILRARVAFETFAEKIISIAPNTNFELTAHKSPHSSGWHAAFKCTGEETSEAHEVAQRIFESEKRGATSRNLYAVCDNYHVTLVHSRDATEALADLGWTLSNCFVLPMMPISLQEIAEAEAKVDAMWQERRKAPRTKKTDS